MEIGDLVEITIQKKIYYGVLKWIGKHERTPDIMAGVEFESNEMSACTDGTFLGVKYFDSPTRRAFFTKLLNFRRDSRISRPSINSSTQALTASNSSLTANRMELTSEQLSMEIGDLVEITIQKKIYYGVLKWIGKHERTPNIMAGVEFETDEMTVCTDGSFLGTKYFDSPTRRAFFTKLLNFRRDSRFSERLDANIRDEEEEAIEQVHIPDAIREICECAICLEIFGDPKSLQCEHHFCKRCLEGLVRGENDKHFITCPLCNGVHLLASGTTVESLRCQLSVKQLVDALGRAKAS